MPHHVAPAPVLLFLLAVAITARTHSCISLVEEAVGELGRQQDEGRNMHLVSSASAPGDVQRQQMRQWSSPLIADARTGRDPWEGLPTCLVVHIYGLLPVPQRLCCREVCRLWRSLLAAPHNWAHIDLSSAATGVFVKDGGGVTEAKFLALLDAASRAACGQAETLDVSGAFQHLTDPVSIALMRVVCDNAASLRTVRITETVRGSRSNVGGDLGFDSGSTHDAAGEPYLTVAAILTAAPNLSALEVEVGCWLTVAELQAVLGTSSDARIRILFAPVRVCALSVYVGGTSDPEEDITFGYAFLASAPAHTWLRRVTLECNVEEEVPPVLLPLIIQGVGAMAGRLEVIDIDGPALVPGWLPVLTSSLRSGTLRELHYHGRALFTDTHVPPAMPAVIVAQFCDALRESRVERLTLTAQLLDEWNDAASFDSVLSALAGHRTLRVLEMQNSAFRARRPAASAQLASSLAGLLAANSPPALVSLHISDNDLGPDELALVFRALASNTHLRELKCRQGIDDPPDQGINEAFARQFVIPAVRACGSLRTLDWDDVHWGCKDAAPAVCAILEERREAE